MYENDLWYYQKYEHCQWGALWGNPDLTMGVVVTSEPPADPDQPSGPDQGVPLTEFTFSTTSTDPEGDQILYMWSWGDENQTEWIGPYNSGETVEATHMWENIGNYEIKVRAKDVNGAKSEWSEIKMFQIGDNTPPSTPILDGKTNTRPGTLYTLKVTSTDPHDHDVYYQLSWGDSGSGWDGPYTSGETIEYQHTWDNQGTFTIKVKAKDSFDAESDFATLTVEVQKNKAITNPILLQFIEKIFQNFPILAKLLL
jgi:predicted phage tail protein